MEKQQLTLLATKKNLGVYEVRNWYPHEGAKLYNGLEIQCWPKYLEASESSLSGRARTFQQGQFVVVGENDLFIASLSTNRISWDGNDTNTLPCWDEAAGDPTTYEKTYDPYGPTLVLLSMNVHPDYRGSGVTNIIFEKAKETAQMLGIQYLVVSARPSEYGEAKMSNNPPKSFGDYCAQTYFSTKHNRNVPVDPWIRSLYLKGMRPLKVDKKAMRVEVTINEFNAYRETGQWFEVSQNIWECGEVGQWRVFPDIGIAVYEESNLYMKYQG